jgi:hypothetical protein
MSTKEKRKPARKPMMGDRVSGTFKGFLYHGWFVCEDNGFAVIELDPKYGSLGHHGGYIPIGYVKKRNGDRFFNVENVRLIGKWTVGSPDPSVGYTVLKSRKKGSVRVGDLWITLIEKTPEK